MKLLNGGIMNKLDVRIKMTEAVQIAALLDPSIAHIVILENSD